MKAIILAGGFATRLWPITKFIPKALLPIAGKPILDFQMEQIALVDEIDQILISTNASFENHFRYWWQRLPLKMQEITRLIIEPARKEEEKLGAIKAMQFIIEHENVAGHDLLITGGDNLFDFSFTDFIAFYKKKRSPVVAFCKLSDMNEIKGKYGVAILDKDNRIKEFEEKAEEPISTLVSTACYLFPPSIIEYLREYAKDKRNTDAPGHFLRWLHRRTSVYGFVFECLWCDIGCVESYEDANQKYATRVKFG